jgi:Fe-S-cluster-containing hydrogenase component 2
MAKFLLIYPEKCLGCRICEMFCSLSHTDTCNPARSRVNIIKMDLDVRCVPMVCQQCAEPACEKACPSGAIQRNECTGAMETDPKRCIGCRMCVLACPFGGTGVDPREGTVMRCDLCQGEPKCAEVCPYGAIVYVEADRQALHKKRSGAERFLTSLENQTGKGN